VSIDDRKTVHEARASDLGNETVAPVRPEKVTSLAGPATPGVPVLPETPAAGVPPAKRATTQRSLWERITGRKLSILNQRRLANFRANSRGFVSFWLFLTLFIISMLANVVANDRPLMILFKGHVMFPVAADYPETAFGGEFETAADYRDPFVQGLIRDAGGWVLWPPIRYSYDTVLRELPSPAPSPPTWSIAADKRCAGYTDGAANPNCTIGNWNWIGTDDQGRDVLARIIYGFRLSVLFGLILSVISSIIGILAGAVQGYFGGWVDLGFQRFIEIWTSIPQLYVLLILSAVFEQGFWTLLGILLMFSWVSLVALVRAEFLRGRNFEYVRAARALGLTDIRIMLRHILPNALVATVTFMPFIVSGSITSLTALDYLGLGLPVGYPSLGELLQQGKANINAPWLGFTAFFVIAIMLSLLVFIGEAVRDALDPRKTFT
jgi:microcin C transport system permease protein